MFKIWGDKMQETKKIINFKWERYKYLLRKIIFDIKKLFMKISSSNNKQTVNKGGKNSLNNKKRKVKKLK